MKKPCIVLTGPTAVGKTNLSIMLAQALNGSIISADSMQVYKKMDIGSAKIREEEKQGIPHYLIDVLDPREDFNVAVFKDMAEKAIDEILSVGRIPIITGGTGFYIQALLKNVNFSEESGPSSSRCAYEKLLEENGPFYIHDLLKQKDPEAALAIHPNNCKRVIRALEFFDQTGIPISKHNKEEREKGSSYCSLYLVLNDERENLYRRIDARVDEMIRSGLVDEVKKLYEEGLDETYISMKGLGYKELFPYFRGEETLEECIRIIKRDTRHFAKRQITWFKREEDVVWINKPDFDYDDKRILSHILKLWEKQQKEEDQYE